MSRRGGRRGGRGSYSRGLPLFGRGFGGSRHASSSSSGGSLTFFAILGWFLLVYLIVANRPNKPVDPTVATEEDTVALEASVPDDKDFLEIVPDSYESYDHCMRGALGTSGIVSYGNMSIELIDETSMTYNFEITANGYKPTYLSVSFLKEEFPDPDRVSVFPYIVLPDGTDLAIGQHQWEHHEWENRFLIFRTTSGETGLIMFGERIMMYGVGATDAKNFCTND